MHRTDQKAFLVFSGGNDRAVLGFLRALAQCGRRAHIVARTRADRILSTRYRRDVVHVREGHALNMRVFTECVEKVRGAVGPKALVVLPSTEYFNAFLLAHRAEIERLGCEIPLVGAAIYKLLTNKGSAAGYFAGKGISIPREVGGTTDIEPPVVAKPRDNVSSDGRSLYPQLLMNVDDVAAFRKGGEASAYFFQEYLEGENLYLLFYLPRRGGDPFAWSQRNLLQQPGGKSMLLAEPAGLHRSELAQKFMRALQEVGFWGLGMIEIIRSGERDLFIEMNPRIWGPIQLAVDHRQPLLAAMIGDALHDDPGYFQRAFAGSVPAEKRYFWCGGLAATLASRRQPRWHGPRRSLAMTVAAELRNDVYLRADSWRCFFGELARTLRLAWHRERTED